MTQVEAHFDLSLGHGVGPRWEQVVVLVHDHGVLVWGGKHNVFISLFVGHALQKENEHFLRREVSPPHGFRRIVGVERVVDGVVVGAVCLQNVARRQVDHLGVGENPLPIEVPVWDGNQRNGVLSVRRPGKHLPRFAQQVTVGCDADQAHVLTDGHRAVERGDLVGRDDERAPPAIEVGRIHDVRFHFALDGFLREEEVDLGLVHLLHS